MSSPALEGWAGTGAGCSVGGPDCGFGGGVGERPSDTGREAGGGAPATAGNLAVVEYSGVAGGANGAELGCG